MSGFFSKKKTPKELERENAKVLRKATRDIERERLDLDRREAKLILEIKAVAKKNDRESLAVLSKLLIQIRKQRSKTYVANSKIQSIGAQQKMINSNVAMAGVMANTTQAMKSMNKTMDPIKTAQTMRDFQRESDRLGMTEEMMNDTMDDIMNGSDVEEECDDIVNQVLDEIGIDINAMMSKAPAAHDSSLKAKEAADLADIEKKLEALRG